ncbi:hypothetical protein [Nocardiopsis sp. LOL_012]|uniref:hypothetical protein n=1 Tax=Nocardiopsis sp. LOL_012 TaxID=3345409 RepID=UPI003A83F716
MDLTLTDAWTLWWSGQQLTNHTLYGVPVLWLSRSGKLLAFLAGCTIVLDIIGSERLIAWGEQIQTNKGRRLLWGGVLVGAAVAIPIYVSRFSVPEFAAPSGFFGVFSTIDDSIQWAVDDIIVPVALFLLFVLSPLAADKTPDFVIGFGQLLTRPHFEKWLRIIAAPLFFIGFTLDYLAS